MRTTLFLCMLVITSLTSAAQKISYDPPATLPKTIGEADYKFIVDSSLAIIGKRYKIESVKAGSIHVKDDKQQPFILNLDNLILKCLADSDRATWITVIHDHYNSLFASIDARKQLDPASYQTIKKYLSIRIYPKETVDERGGTDSVITRTDLEGTYTMLMLDLPGAFTPVQKSMFDHWNQNIAEVFKVAQNNIDSQQVKKVTKSFDVGGVSVEVEMLGEENYAASYALDLLNNSPELLGEWGAAVSMPNKGLVSLCKISHDKPLDFVKFIQLTQPFIEKSYQEHPQPISDQFFWYYKGKFTHIQVTTDSTGRINVIAPFGLTELMTQKN